MQLSVTGKQIDVGDALRGHITTTLDAAVSKYFENAIEGSVTIARRGHAFRADISVHIGRNILIQGHAEEGDAYAAFDAACERIATRLRRYKSRLRDHRKSNRAEDEVTSASQYILAGDEDGEDKGPESDNPVVVAEMETGIETLTVSEAVMRMDLADTPAILFRNRAHGGLNMVYRRSDGNIGWIDPDGGKNRTTN
jgi:ribosomal subunit interface protein